MKLKNIIAWIFIVIGISIVFYCTYFLFIKIMPLCKTDPAGCGLGGGMTLVYMITFGGLPILVGLLIFLVSWIIGKIKNKK